MLKKCIAIWSVIIFTNQFLGMRIYSYALKVITILDKLTWKRVICVIGKSK